MVSGTQCRTETQTRGSLIRLWGGGHGGLCLGAPSWLGLAGAHCSGLGATDPPLVTSPREACGQGGVTPPSGPAPDTPRALTCSLPPSSAACPVFLGGLLSPVNGPVSALLLSLGPDQPLSLVGVASTLRGSPGVCGVLAAGSTRTLGGGSNTPAWGCLSLHGCPIGGALACGWPFWPVPMLHHLLRAPTAHLGPTALPFPPEPPPAPPAVPATHCSQARKGGA